MSEVWVRTRTNAADLRAMVGNPVHPNDVDLLVRGRASVYIPDPSAPNGRRLLLRYLPRTFSEEETATHYEVLHELKQFETNNRGAASGGGERVRRGNYMYAEPVASAVIGALDPIGSKQYCRLTAWSGREVERFASLFPMFGRIADRLAAEVPDRFAAQMRVAIETHPDWVIPGTPFTTITVNNSYPTGVHTDKGDLHEGYSTLAVIRRGEYVGGWLTFPEWRVAVDMHDGDLLLMDAHEWHGNTPMTCTVCGLGVGPGSERKYHDETCGTERISVVSYYRTKMKDCGSMEDEALRAKDGTDRRLEVTHQRVIEEMAQEASG